MEEENTKAKKCKNKKKVRIIACSIIAFAIAAFLAYPLFPLRVKKPDAKEIYEDTYNFHDGFVASNMYLLVGKEKALLIDTGYGLCRLDEAVKEITDLPVIVVNTHGHYDHVGNNGLFDEVYLSEKDFDLYEYYYQDEVLDMVYDRLPWIFRHLSYQEKKAVKDKEPANVLPLPAEGYFELGGRKVSFFETPGHTPGSICLYDENNHVLFDGDMAGVLLDLPLSDPVETYLESAVLINRFINENNVEKIYSGHAGDARNPDVYQSLEQAARDIVEGNLSEKEMKSGKHTVNGMTINFYPDNIKKNRED